MAYQGEAAELEALDPVSGYEPRTRAERREYLVVPGGRRPNTNQDVADLLDKLCDDPETAAILMTAAICDFDGTILNVNVDLVGANLRSVVTETPTPSGKTAPRLHSREAPFIMRLTPAEKLVSKIRQTRPDIILMGCKTTDGVNDQTMKARGRRQMKEAGCDIVLVNDVKRHRNIVTARLRRNCPDLLIYDYVGDRPEMLELVANRVRHMMNRPQVA